jgi:hypothetical protein
MVIVILKNYSAPGNDAPVMMVTGTEGQVFRLRFAESPLRG